LDIKFRGKAKKTGEWVYGYYVKFPLIHDAFIIFKGEHNVRFDFPVYEETVGQFTCLYDRYQNEIYEGDIIEVDGGLYQVVKSKEPFVGFHRKVIKPAPGSCEVEGELEPLFNDNNYEILEDGIVKESDWEDVTLTSIAAKGNKLMINRKTGEIKEI